MDSTDETAAPAGTRHQRQSSDGPIQVARPVISAKLRVVGLTAVCAAMLAASTAGCLLQDPTGLPPTSSGGTKHRDPAHVDAGADGTDAAVAPDAGSDAGVGTVGGEDDAGVPVPADAGVETDPLAGLPKGDRQLGVVCQRGRANAVTKALCASPAPGLQSLADLQRVLGLAFADPTANGDNGDNGNPAFALTSHSISLVTRTVSAVNPEAIVFTPSTGGDQVFLAFSRGEPFVQLAAVPANGAEPTFYLVTFQPACGDPARCGPLDLVTPAVERNWKGWTMYEDVDLANTTLDCLQCHQPQGSSTPKFLRMQELTSPWTHWFNSGTPNRSTGGRAVLADFHAAHGTSEDYGPIPAALIDRSDPALLARALVINGFGSQPNAFPSATIEREVQRSQGQQPAVNVPVGASATWQGLFDAAAAGQAIPPPYHDVKITDPSRLAEFTTAYAAYRAAALGTASSLPDIRSIFLADALVATFVRAQPSLDGPTLVKQMCGQCHNPKLDQTLTRARFDATRLDQLSPAERDEAVARLGRDPEDRLAMPPSRFHELTDAERLLLVQTLKR